MTTLYAQPPGLLAPGLHGWSNSAPVLRGEIGWQATELPKIQLDILPRNERRRATPAIKLALHVAQEATAELADRTGLLSVFACSGGDTDTLDKICTALTSAGRPVSPAHFSNSVHNAPAGYWSIATGSKAPSTSLSAYDSTFAAGMLEAATLGVIEQREVLLVAYDVPPPAPLLPFRPLTAPFGVAMVLTALKSERSTHSIGLEITENRSCDELPDNELELLRQGNPAARSLPLLVALATRKAQNIHLPYLPENQLHVQVRPC